MKQLYFSVIAALLFSTSCPARLGENERECETRYGRSQKQVPPPAPATKALAYSKDGLSIVVGFINGHAAYLVFWKDGERITGRLSTEESMTLLAASGDGYNWAITRDDKSAIQYQRDDGKARAIYNQTEGRLFIMYAERSRGLSMGRWDVISP